MNKLARIASLIAAVLFGCSGIVLLSLGLLLPQYEPPEPALQTTAKVIDKEMEVEREIARWDDPLGDVTVRYNVYLDFSSSDLGQDRIDLLNERPQSIVVRNREVFDHFYFWQTVTIVYYNPESLHEKVCVESVDGYHDIGATGDLTTVKNEESAPLAFLIPGGMLLVMAVIVLIGWGAARVVYLPAKEARIKAAALAGLTFLVLIIIGAMIGGFLVAREEPLFIKILAAFIFAFAPIMIFSFTLPRYLRWQRATTAKEIRRMRNGLGALHIYFRAILYSYLLFFVLVPVVLISLGISSVIGQNNPPEEGIWWFPFIAVFLALLTYGVLYCFTRHAKLWGIYRDLFSSRTKMSGRVSKKWVEVKHGQYTTRQHWIQVGGKSFEVFGRVYEWIWQGNEVTVLYWPRSETVSSIEKLNI